MSLFETVWCNATGHRVAYFLHDQSPIITFIRGIEADLRGRPLTRSLQAVGSPMARIQTVRTGRDDRQTRLSPALASAGLTNFWWQSGMRKPRWGEPAGLGSLAGPDEGVSASDFNQAADERRREAGIVELGRRFR